LINTNVTSEPTTALVIPTTKGFLKKPESFPGSRTTTSLGGCWWGENRGWRKAPTHSRYLILREGDLDLPRIEGRNLRQIAEGLYPTEAADEFLPPPILFRQAFHSTGEAEVPGGLAQSLA